MTRLRTDWNNERQTVEINGRTYHFKSKLERRWAEYLEFLKLADEINGWEYEPKKFLFEAIQSGTRVYTPDFKVYYPYGRHEWHETKGWLVQKDVTKFRRMAKYYPNEKIILVLQSPSKKRVVLHQAAERAVERVIYANKIFRQCGIN